MIKHPSLPVCTIRDEHLDYLKMTPFCLSSLSLTLRENKLERLQIVIISGFDIIYRVRPEAYTNAVKHRKVASRK
jgi:hypothetical protein